MFQCIFFLISQTSLPPLLSVTTCIYVQDCEAVFQEEQPQAQQYHLTQQEWDVFLPADGTFSHGREQATGYHFRPSISTWAIRVRPSQKTPLGSFWTHLRRKINCAVLRENYCCLFLRTASAITIWEIVMGAENLSASQRACVTRPTSSPPLENPFRFGQVVNLYKKIHPEMIHRGFRLQIRVWSVKTKHKTMCWRRKQDIE